MKTRVMASALAVVLVGFEGTSMAGAVLDGGAVGNNAGYWSGAMGKAYAIGDGIQYIGCSVSANTTGSVVTCFATNSAGASASCTTTSPTETANLIAVLATITSDAWLMFLPATDGTCADVFVQPESQAPPKKVGD
jgi:hypothetical protein